MVSVRIPLTQNKFARVSIEDAQWALSLRWAASRATHTYYAVRGIQRDGKATTIAMHNMIAGKGYDHVNRDGLDNRRSNLRPATPSQQCMNRRTPSNNTSGYKGVSWSKRDQRWTACIKKNGKVISLGYFARMEDAIAARKSAEQELFGEFAVREGAG